MKIFFSHSKTQDLVFKKPFSKRYIWKKGVSSYTQGRLTCIFGVNTVVNTSYLHLQLPV